MHINVIFLHIVFHSGEGNGRSLCMTITLTQNLSTRILKLLWNSFM